MTTANKASLQKLITEICNSEKGFKAKFTQFSREVLPYILETKDTGILNRLFDGLTPMNKKLALHFFPTFIPWDWDKDKQTFGKMKNAKTVASKTKKIEESLKDPDFNIFTWAERNVSVDKKPTNWSKRLENTLQKGFEETGDTQLTLNDLASALVSVKGIDLAKLLSKVSALSE